MLLVVSDFDEFRVLLRLSGFEEDLLEAADSFRGHYIDDTLKHDAYEKFKNLVETFPHELRYEIEVRTSEQLEVDIRVLPKHAPESLMPNWLRYTVTYK